MHASIRIPAGIVGFPEATTLSLTPVPDTPLPFVRARTHSDGMDLSFLFLQLTPAQGAGLAAAGLMPQGSREGVPDDARWLVPCVVMPNGAARANLLAPILVRADGLAETHVPVREGLGRFVHGPKAGRTPLDGTLMHLAGLGAALPAAP